MSDKPRRAGSVTILMWVVVVMVMPGIGYVANNALQMPTVITKLGHLVETQQGMLKELKSIAGSVRNQKYNLANIKEDCKDNMKDLESCIAHSRSWTIHNMKGVTK